MLRRVLTGATAEALDISTRPDMVGRVSLASDILAGTTVESKETTRNRQSGFGALFGFFPRRGASKMEAGASVA